MLFEWRAYDFAPGMAPRYLDLFQSTGLAHVTRHLPFAGYWLTDSGPLNRLYHLWIYESLSERATLRAGLMADRDWVEGFVPQGFPMIAAQHSTLMRQLSGSAKLDAVIAARKAVHPARAAGSALFAQTCHSVVVGPGEGAGGTQLGRWQMLTGSRAGAVLSLYASADADQLLGTAPMDLQLLRPCTFSPLF